MTPRQRWTAWADWWRARRVEILRDLRDRSAWPWGHRRALERGLWAQLVDVRRATGWARLALDGAWSVTPGPDLPFDRELSPLEWAVRDSPWAGVEYGLPAEREELARWLDTERKAAARQLIDEDLCPVCGAEPTSPPLRRESTQHVSVDDCGCIECRLAGRVPWMPYPAHWVTERGMLTWDRADYREREDGTVYYTPRGGEDPPRVDWRSRIYELRDRAVGL